VSHHFAKILNGTTDCYHRCRSRARWLMTECEGCEEWAHVECLTRINDAMQRGAVGGALGGALRLPTRTLTTMETRAHTHAAHA
jgi:hypothetical protein